MKWNKAMLDSNTNNYFARWRVKIGFNCLIEGSTPGSERSQKFLPAGFNQYILKNSGGSGSILITPEWINIAEPYRSLGYGRTWKQPLSCKYWEGNTFSGALCSRLKRSSLKSDALCNNIWGMGEVKPLMLITPPYTPNSEHPTAGQSARVPCLPSPSHNHLQELQQSPRRAWGASANDHRGGPQRLYLTLSLGGAPGSFTARSKAQ